MNKDITDFSAKDSKAFDESTRLFEEAGLESSKELRCFRDNIYNNSKFSTRLKPKTSNSKNFLDEDYQAARKMNVNTSAIQELLTEKLMFGSTDEDLDMEITEGGVATEIADVLAKHGITGGAIKDTFRKLETFYGKSPDSVELATGAKDEEFDDEDETSEEEPAAEAEESLEEKYNKVNDLLRKVEATRNLKKRFSESKKRSLKEALLVAPTGSFNAKAKRGVKFVSISDETLDDTLQESKKKEVKEHSEFRKHFCESVSSDFKEKVKTCVQERLAETGDYTCRLNIKRFDKAFEDWYKTNSAQFEQICNEALAYCRGKKRSIYNMIETIPEERAAIEIYEIFEDSGIADKIFD